MISGAAKKVLLGDFLGTRLVSPAFAHPEGIGAPGVALGVVGFAFQLYGDFAGYSEIAIGSARCLGIRLATNFDAPYRARSVQEFWQRWHITLSFWIRDYVFLPLCGRGPSRARALAAAVASMTLCGLWHGASAAWIAWGAWHGVGLAVHQVWVAALRRRLALKRRLDASAWARGVSRAATFAFCCAGLFVVRGADPVLSGAAGEGEAWARFGRLLSEALRAPSGDGVFFAAPLSLFVLALAIASHAFPGRWKLAAANAWASTPRLLQGASVVVVVHALFLVRPDRSPFLYTNF
jgi:hypothetical protein